MGGRLTTHVLDQSLGLPAAGMIVRLRRLDGPGAAGALLGEAVTDEEGRLAVPLLEGEAMKPGLYELEFEVGRYFRRGENEGADRRTTDGGTASRTFYDTVPVRFQIRSIDEHYHVPLLIAPGGYSTYRGS